MAVANTNSLVHAGSEVLRVLMARKKVWSKLIANRFVFPHVNIPSTVRHYSPFAKDIDYLR